MKGEELNEPKRRRYMQIIRDYWEKDGINEWEILKSGRYIDLKKEYMYKIIYEIT